MTKLISLLIICGFANNLWCHDKLRNTFTKDIYDCPEGQDAEEFLREKKLATVKGKYLNDLEKQKRQYQKSRCQLLGDQTAILVGAIGTTAMYAASLLSGGWTIGVGFLLYKGFNKSDECLGRKDSRIGQINQEMSDITDAIKSGELFDCECHYLKCKPKLPLKIRKLCENELIAAYDKSVDDRDMEFVWDLIYFPLSTTPMFNDNDQGAFRETLKDLSQRLEHILMRRSADQRASLVAKSILTTLAQGIFHNKRQRAFYIKSQDISAMVDLVGELADMLHLPALNFEARYHPELSDRLLHGAYKKEPGLYLLPFLVATRGDRTLDPVLIIKNMDLWIKDRRNIGRLLKLFDSEAKTFQSYYYGMEFDWSKLTIVGIGTSHWRDWPGTEYDAIRSRLSCKIHN